MPHRHTSIGASRLRAVADQLARDDASIREDDRLTRLGKKIYYAVDASEIYSYVFFGKTYYVEQETNDSLILSLALNEMVLSQLLVSGDFNIFMLPSHRLEFRQLIETIGEREVSDLGRILSSLGKIKILSAELRSLIEGFNRTPDGPERMSLASNLISKAALEAPDIFLLARVPTARPRSRLNKLLLEIKLRPLHSLVGTSGYEIEAKDSVVEQAFQSFEKFRKGDRTATNRVDAFAVANLHALVSSAPSRTIFRFVSRSRIFAHVCGDLAEKGIISREVFRSIRHPRAFSAYAIARSTGKSITELVGQRLSATTAFLAASATYDEMDSADAQNSAGTNDFSKALIQIEQIALLSTLSHAEQSPTSFHTDVKQLVTLLQDGDILRNAIRHRAIEIIDQIDVQTLSATGNIAIGKFDQIPEIIAEISDECSLKAKSIEYSIPVNIKSPENNSISPFMLEFYSKTINERVRRGDDPREILSEFIVSNYHGDLYERWLAAAYIAGINGEWALAYAFVDAALKRPAFPTTVPRHEGHYFRAIARRYDRRWRAENITDSIDDLNQAIKLREKLIGESAKNDPRYLNEKAILINQAKYVSISAEALEKIGAGDDPIEIWKKLYESPLTPFEYKMNAINNICHDYVERACETHLIVEKLINLLDFLKINGFSRENVPAAVQETILCAELAVGIYNQPSEKSAALKRLEQLRRDPYVSKRPEAD